MITRDDPVVARVAAHGADVGFALDGDADRCVAVDAADLIHIGLTADTPQVGPLFNAIPLRQNTRSEYDGKAVKSADLDQVQALSLEPGIGLRFVTTPSDLIAAAG